MAGEQVFKLVKCLYDRTLQWHIVYQIMKHFIAEYYSRKPTHKDLPDLVKQITWERVQHLAKIGVIMKHEAFQDENEWRLLPISPVNEINNNDPGFRASYKGLVPYFKFRLVNEVYPDLIWKHPAHLVIFVGPSVDMDN